MKKKVCFFSVGFAFNRFNRLKYYEKIFPKDTEIFLFTTKKYEGTEKGYEGKWDLKRTKVFYVGYNPIKLVFQLRKFCKENKIDRLINLGTSKSGFILLFASIFTKADYIVNIFDVITPDNFSKYKETINFLTLLFLISLSKRAVFVDQYDRNRVGKILDSFKDLKFLPAPTDTKLSKPKSQVVSRKKLKLPLNKKTIIFVGRINHAKGSDILIELIKKHKDILFLVIGKIVDESFKNLKEKNLIHYQSKTSEELVDLYNSADLGFFLQRLQGAGLGQTTQEAMACGIPSINRKWHDLIKSPALFLIPINIKAASRAIDSFFKKTNKERKELRKEARLFIEKNYSGEALKNKYKDYYLN